MAIPLAFSACRSTTSPTCTDPRATNQATALNVTCSAVGSDLQCSAVATNSGELYVCREVSDNVTAQATWKSASPAVGAFLSAPPGLLKVLALGQVDVSATYGLLQSSATTYAVAPGTPPERMIQVSVIVEDSRTGARVPDVLIEIFPDRGNSQTCVTNQFGSCLPFPLVLRGATRVRASKSGYTPIDMTLPAPDASFFQATILKLSPS